MTTLDYVGRRAIVPLAPARNRTNAAWLSAQLEGLATELAYGSRPITLDQHRRILTGIAHGIDWRDGAWR